MASGICCTGGDRADSPDAPNARQPVTSPAKPRPLPQSQINKLNKSLSLTPSDIRELRENVPIPLNTDIGSNTPSTLRSRGSPKSQLLSCIKKRLSRESTLLKKSPVKAPLRLLKSLSRVRAESPHTAEAHELDLLSDDVCGCDDDAQALTDLDLTQRFLQNSPSQLSYSQPSDTCVTTSAEINRVSESTGLATDSQTSHSGDCFQSVDLQAGSAPNNSNVTASRASHLGRFPFEKSPRSYRSRPISQNSDIALAAATLFDTLCSQFSSRNETEPSEVGALSNQPCFETPQLQANEPSSCCGVSAEISSKVAGGNSVQQSIPESKQLIDPVKTNLTISNEELPSMSSSESPKSSIHLYDMRISQHLRSMSNLSHGSSTQGADNTTNHYQRSKKSIEEELGDRPNVCRKSSSGFSSIAVPTSWGLVVRDRMSIGDVEMHPSSLYELDRQPGHTRYKSRHDASVNKMRPNLMESSELGNTQDSLIDQHTALRISTDKPENSKPKIPRKFLLHQGSTAHTQHHSQSPNSYAPTRISIIETRLGTYNTARKISRFPGLMERALGERESNTCYQLNSENIHSAFDGPVDHHVAPDEAISRVQTPQPESVGGNYEKTMILWEKAMRAHQEDEGSTERKRGSSFSNLSRKSSHHSRVSTDISDTQKSTFLLEPSPRKSSSHLNTIPLKRVNTAHSFDLLTIPGRESVTQPPSPVNEEEQIRRSSAFLTADGRIRSISQPPLDRGSIATLAHMSSQLLVHGVPLHGQRIPEITLTDAQSPSNRPLLVRSRQRKLTGLQAWSRYPSHTRKERNGPAGVADNVLAHDFQVDVDFRMDQKIDKNQLAKTVRFGGKSKWRTRAMIFRGKFLTDIPTIFKYRTNNEFRRRQHGHRSSISTGGVLEYPELELLPLSEPRRPVATDDLLLDSVRSEAIPSSFAFTRDSVKQRGSSPGSAARLGSSNYGSIPDQAPNSAESSGGQLTANCWADIYGQYVPQRAKQQCFESVSTLDGVYGAFPFSRPASPGTVSLPPMLRKDGFERVKIERNRAVSAQGMRRSTQNLFKTLEDGEEAEVARALKAAEDAFMD